MTNFSRLSLLPTVFLASLAWGSAHAEVLVQYGFDTVDNVNGTSPATIIAGGLSATDAANNNADNPLGSNPLGFFGQSTFTGNNTDGTGIIVGTGGTAGAGTGSVSVLNFRATGGQTLAEALMTNDGIPTSGEYFSFTLSGAGDNTLDLSSISYDMARGGSSSSDRGVVVWYSTDGFLSNATVLGNGAENTAVYTGGINDQLARNVSFSLASVPETDSIAFRFFSTNAAGNTIKLDNITIEGVVIPEPGAGALLLSSVAVLGLVRRRR